MNKQELLNKLASLRIFELHIGVDIGQNIDTDQTDRNRTRALQLQNEILQEFDRLNQLMDLQGQHPDDYFKKWMADETEIKQMKEYITKANEVILDKQKTIQEQRSKAAYHNAQINDLTSMICDYQATIKDQRATIEDQKTAIENQSLTIEKQKEEIENQKADIKDRLNEIEWIKANETFLKDRLKSRDEVIQDYVEKMRQALAETRALREALKWYGDIMNYKDGIPGKMDEENQTNIFHWEWDWGAKARKALEGEPDDKE
jgi:chromosome segregation ATPase